MSDELDNSGLFTMIQWERCRDTIEHGPPELAVHLYRKERGGLLNQLVNLHRGLNEVRGKTGLLGWLNKNRIKYLEQDIKQLQMSLATLRRVFWNPLNRLTRNLSGYP